MEHSRSERIEVFISYAHEDNEDSDPKKRWLERLEKHLTPLVSQGLVNAWSDQKIDIGEDWHKEIQQRLDSSKVAVLLVSSAFLASQYIRNSELPALLEAKEKGLIILPIILGPCLIQETKFKYPDPENGPKELSLASLQAIGSPEEPLSKLNPHEQEEKLVAIAQRILKLVPANPPLVPANPSEKPVPSHSTQIELAQQAREKIDELINKKPKLRPLRESLLQRAVERRADENLPQDPINLLVPEEAFSIEDSIKDLHEATKNCLELMDRDSGSVSDIGKDTTTILGWLVLLAVSEIWVQKEAKLSECLSNANYIDITIPVETEAGTEVVFSRLRSCPAKLILADDGVTVYSPYRLAWHNLELGIGQRDRLTEIKKFIWKTEMKSDVLNFGEPETKRLRARLKYRFQRGESHYFIMPGHGDNSSATDNDILAQLRRDFPHLVFFLIGVDSGDEVFVIEEYDLEALVGEFFLMLRKYL